MKFIYIFIIGLFALSISSCSFINRNSSDLIVGSCFDVPPEGEFSDVELLSCDESPTAQVYAEFRSEEIDYSKLINSELNINQESGIVINSTELKCNEFLVELIEADEINLPEDFQMFTIHPSEEAWIEGDKTVLCLVTSELGLEGSLIK